MGQIGNLEQEHELPNHHYIFHGILGALYMCFFPSRTAKFKTSNSEDLLGVLCLKNHGVVYLPCCNPFQTTKMN
jgi:hypothetical protein